MNGHILARTTWSRSLTNHELANELQALAYAADRDYSTEDHPHSAHNTEALDTTTGCCAHISALSEAIARLNGDDIPTQFNYRDQEWIDAKRQAEQATIEYNRLCHAFEELLHRYNTLTPNVPTTGDTQNPTDTDPNHA